MTLPISHRQLGHEIPVTEQHTGTRLDRFLAQQVDHMSRDRAREWIQSGRVTVNQKYRPKSHLVTQGDRVQLRELPIPKEFEPLPNPNLALDVRHEDEYVWVVHKPRGMHTHPLGPADRDTLVNALVARDPTLHGVGYGPTEPGILHRLDRWTSGLVIVAKTQPAFEHLRRQLKRGAIEKEYTLLCAGIPAAPQTLNHPIADHPADPKRVVVVDRADSALTKRARPAHTVVLSAEPVSEREGNVVSRVYVQANHATRHQVRAHLAHAGHPLLGDATYGGPPMPNLKGHALHASLVRFTHPKTGFTLEIQDPAPPPVFPKGI